jgi:glycosyltransferase involved in cell wall biosynthesis
MSASDYSKQLSIICPVSDMAGRLDRLQEWLSQVNFQSTQVIVVHDKRDENTGIELRSIISRINSPGLILKEGFFGTAAGARNSALGNCDGEWICFWDSDDQPNYELVLKGLNSSCDVVIGGFSVVMPTGLNLNILHGINDAQSLSRVSFDPGLWRMVFRAKVIRNLTFPEIVMGEDQCFLAQLNWDTLKTKYTDDVYYNYFSGWENQTTSQGKSRLPLVQSLRILQHLLKEKTGKEEFIRNMASRQILTLFKSHEFKAKSLAVVELTKLVTHPSGFFKQIKSFKDLAFYLLKSAP